MKEFTFDLYSRNRLVQEMIEKSVRKYKQRLSIIDLGGYNGNIEVFFPHDDVTVLDVYEVQNKKNYIKGDAINLDFDDNSFDISTSFDVFEHIPRKKREKFIKESVRVAKTAAFLTFPMEQKDGSVGEAEKDLNEYFKNLTGKDHPWLIEHINYGIPFQEEVESILKKTGLEYIYIPSNDLELWKDMMRINFTSVASPDAVEVSEFFNKIHNDNLEYIERGINKSYRAVYIIIKDGKLSSLLNKMSSDGSVFNIYGRSNKDQIDANTLSKLVKSKIYLMYASKVRDYNSEILKANMNENKIKSLEHELSYVLNSKSWKITQPIRRIQKIIKSYKAD